MAACAQPAASIRSPSLDFAEVLSESRLPRSAAVLQLEPSSLPASRGSVGLLDVQGVVSNESPFTVETIQHITLLRMEGDRVAEVLCGFGTIAPPSGPPICGLEESRFPLPPGAQFSNETSVAITLPATAVKLLPGDYVAALPVWDMQGHASLAVAAFTVTP